MKTTLKVYGLKELDAAIAELIDSTSSATAKNAIRRGLIEAAEPMAERARQLVPVRSGALRDSITVSARLKNSVGKAAFAQAKRAGLSDTEAVAATRRAQREARGEAPSVEVYVGPSGAPASRAHLTEFGTAKAAAQPFMRPAFDATVREVVERTAEAVGQQIQKAADRAARKAAKKARA